MVCSTRLFGVVFGFCRCWCFILVASFGFWRVFWIVRGRSLWKGVCFVGNLV